MSPLLTAALSYAARGWAVLPLHSPTPDGCSCGRADCKTPGKHPFARLVPRGVLDASSDRATITRWWTQYPACNVAIATGAVSRLLVIDLDDRPLDGRNGSQSWRRLATVHEPVDTIEAITGGGGRHLYFGLPADQSYGQSKDAIGLGVEVKSDGGYVVAPPSKHASGRSYDWEAFAHFEEQALAPLPPWLASLCRSRAPRPTTAHERPTGALDALEVAELQSALSAIPADDREVWVAVGMALHAANDDAHAFPLWDQWSATSAKYQGTVDCERTWASFTHRPDGVSLGTLYHMAVQQGWVRPSLETLFRAVGYELPDLSYILSSGPVGTRPAALVAPSDPLVHALPGAIERIAAWSYAGAARSSHVYAVAAALALASVLAGRRYRTTANNFTALYFATIGESGTGKEQVRNTVETALHALGRYDLRGFDTVKSDSGIYSSIYDQPRQIAIVDEFGKFLEAATGKGDAAAMRDGVLTTLTELWGRAAGTAHTPQYSTLNLSDKQRASMRRKWIELPSLTFVGLSTPQQFYGALRSHQVASGFLNRFILLEEHKDSEPFSMAALAPCPPAVLEWGQIMLAARQDPAQSLASVEMPQSPGPPITLDLPDASKALFRAYDIDCLAEAKRLRDDKLGEMPMRAAEQAMRLALMAALADDPLATSVGPQYATWGIDVSRWALVRMIEGVQRNVSDSALEEIRKRFLTYVRNAGPKGVSEYELKRAKLFVGVSMKDADEIVKWALRGQYVEWTMRAHKGAGRPARVLTISHDISDYQGAA